MKKIQFLLAFVVVLCFVSISSGEEKTFYAGLGYANGYETFQTETEFDNTSGFYGRIGHYIDDKLAFELEYRNLPGFESDSRIGAGSLKAEVDIENYLLSIKYDPFTTERLDIYVIGSAGWMNVDTDIEDNQASYFDGLYGSYSDFCIRAGFGVDYFLLKSLALKVEAGSVFGTGDVSDFRFSVWQFGLTIYFF